jgi:hypothetical protein
LAALGLAAVTAAMLSGPVIVVLAVPFCAG